MLKKILIFSLIIQIIQATEVNSHKTEEKDSKDLSTIIKDGTPLLLVSSLFKANSKYKKEDIIAYIIKLKLM